MADSDTNLPGTSHNVVLQVNKVFFRITHLNLGMMIVSFDSYVQYHTYTVKIKQVNYSLFSRITLINRKF